MSEKEGETVMTFANTMLGKNFYQGVEQGMQQGILQELKRSGDGFDGYPVRNHGWN